MWCKKFWVAFLLLVFVLAFSVSAYRGRPYTIYTEIIDGEQFVVVVLENHMGIGVTKK